MKIFGSSYSLMSFISITLVLVLPTWATGLTLSIPFFANERVQNLNNQKILQYQIGKHIFGFASDKVYMLGLGYALIEEFLGATDVAPLPGTSDNHKLIYERQKASKDALTFAGVTYPELWPGITLQYKETPGGLIESVYEIQPGAKVSDIRIRYNVNFKIEKGGAMRLILPLSQDYFELSKPIAWQIINGITVIINVNFLKISEDTVSFTLDRHDERYSVIIDPTYNWHTFQAAGNAEINSEYSMAIDGDAIYITGTSDANWNGPFNTNPIHQYSGNYDILILKLDTNGIYQWHTFYGSTDMDIGRGIAIFDDFVYVTGISVTQWKGDANQDPIHPHNGSGDMIILKLGRDGSYQWHTFYGGSGSDCGTAISVTNDEIYIAGFSYNSWVGDKGDIAIHSHSGEGGNNFVVLKLDHNGLYQWHTFYGSSYPSEHPYDIAATDNEIYVVGVSVSWNGDGGQAPLHSHGGGLGDIVIFKLNDMGIYQWHTFYGNEEFDQGSGIILNGDDVYIVGTSHFYNWLGDNDINPIHPHSQNNNCDMVILKIDKDGQYQWHTFYGPAYGSDIALKEDSVFITGTSLLNWTGNEGQIAKHPFTGYTDIAILNLGNTGRYRSHTFYGSFTRDESNRVVTEGNSIYVLGVSDATWVGDDGAIPLLSFVEDDSIFVMKLTDQEPVPAPNAIANPQVICKGYTATLTAIFGQGETLNWFTVSCGGSPVVDEDPNTEGVQVTPSETTTYYARATNSRTGCVSECAEVTVTVNPLPRCEISAPPNVVYGSSGNTASTICGEAEYQWHLYVDDLPKPELIMAGQGTYKILWTAPGKFREIAIGVVVSSEYNCTCVNDPVIGGEGDGFIVKGISVDIPIVPTISQWGYAGFIFLLPGLAILWKRRSMRW